MRRFEEISFCHFPKTYSDWKLSRSKKDKKKCQKCYKRLMRCFPSALKSYSSSVWGTEPKNLILNSLPGWVCYETLWLQTCNKRVTLITAHTEILEWTTFMVLFESWQFLCSFSVWKRWAFLTIFPNVFRKKKGSQICWNDMKVKNVNNFWFN